MLFLTLGGCPGNASGPQYALDGWGRYSGTAAGAPALSERGQIDPGRAPYRAVAPGPVRGDVDEDLLAGRGRAEPEPAGAVPGEHRREAHGGGRRVPVADATAGRQVQVPGLAVVPGDLWMGRVPHEQAIQPVNRFGAIPGRACGEYLPQLGPKPAHRVKITTGGAAVCKLKIGQQRAESIEANDIASGRFAISSFFTVGSAVCQAHGEFSVGAEIHSCFLVR